MAKDLDALPEDDTTEVFELQERSCQKGEHEFTQISGTEAICSKCPVGYIIGAGTEVKNGHIYIHGEQVI